MISRTFQVAIFGPDGEEDVNEAKYYKGFDHHFDSNPPYVALVRMEDVYDAYALDDNGPALDELKRYLSDAPIDIKLLGVYKHVTD